MEVTYKKETSLENETKAESQQLNPHVPQGWQGCHYLSCPCCFAQAASRVGSQRQTLTHDTRMQNADVLTGDL